MTSLVRSTSRMYPWASTVADVAGAEPAVVGERVGRAVVVVVRAGDPRSGHLELATGLTVPRLLALGSDHPEIDAGHDLTDGGAEVGGFVIGEIEGALDATDRRDRAGLGHPPRLEDGHPDLLAEPLGRAPWAPPSRRRGWLAARTRRDRPAPGGRPSRWWAPPAAIVTRSDSIRPARRGSGQIGSGHDQVGAAGDRGVGQAPGVGVEHRDHRQDGVALASRPDCRPASLPSCAARSSGGSRRPPWVAGGARRVTHRCGPAARRPRGRSTGSAAASSVSYSWTSGPPSTLGSSPGTSVHDHDVTHGLEGRNERGEQSQERLVDEDHLVLGVVDDVRELLGKEPDVERVQHPPGAGRPRTTARGGGRCSTRRCRPVPPR